MGDNILVTGFMPFAHHQDNVSQQIAEAISTDDTIDYEINSSILTVDESGSGETSDRIKREEGIRAILHLGYSENANEVLLERYARNRFEMKIADNSGRIISSGKISSGPPVIETNVPIHIIDKYLEGISGIRWSEDAGGFVCNETYFRTLLAASINDHPVVLFIHLPSDEKIPFIQQLEIIKKVCDALESVIKS